MFIINVYSLVPLADQRWLSVGNYLRKLVIRITSRALGTVFCFQYIWVKLTTWQVIREGIDA